MATIRELFVKIGVDATAVASGVAQAIVSMGRFGDAVEQQSKQVQRASAVVESSTEISERELARATAVWEQQYTKQGRAAAAAAVEVEQAAERTGSAGYSLQRRMNTVSVGVLFAFDAMTRGATAGEGAWRRVLRSMSLLALTVFDPPAGLIVAGVLAATDAIVEAFERQEKAIEKATRAFVTNSIEIARANDVVKASMQQQLAFSGDPFAQRGQGRNVLTGEEVGKDESEAAFTARSRGLQGIAALQEQINRQLDRARSLITANAAATAETAVDFHAVGLIVDPLVKNYAQLVQRSREVNGLALQYAQFNSQAESTTSRVMQHTAQIAANLLEIAQNTKLPNQIAEQAEKLVSIYNELNKRHMVTSESANVLTTAYDRVTAQLDRLKDQGKTAFDPLVESLLRAKAALEGSDIIQLLRLGKTSPLAFPSLTFQTPTGATLQGAGAEWRPSTGGGTSPFLPVQQLQPDLVAQFLRDLANKIPPMTPEEFARTRVFGGVQGAAQPVINASMLDRIIGPTLGATFRQIGDDIKDNVTGMLISSFGPVAILMRALEPAIRALTPLFDRLAVPIAIVAQVMVASIEPALRALYPIIRLLGIAATLVGEVMARVSAAIAQAVGGLIKAIGNLIAHVPGLGGVGHAIANFGQSMLNFADGQKAAADQFAKARKELEAMSWDATAQALDNLQGAAQNAADALTNLPQGFRIQRAIFLASRPANASDFGAGPQGGAGSTNYFAPGSITINTQRQDGAQILDEVTAAAQQKSMARYGTTSNAARVIG